jgi:hypothetical protein
MTADERVGNEHNLHVKIEDDWWPIIERAVVILAPLMRAVKVLEGEKYVTSSWVPWILTEVEFGLRTEMEAAVADPTLYECISRVHLDFKKRFYDKDVLDVPRLVKIAALLDPRTKSLHYTTFSEEEELWAYVSATLMGRFTENHRQNAENSRVVASGVAPNSVASSSSKKKNSVFTTMRMARAPLQFVDTYAADEEHHLDLVSHPSIIPACF